MKFTSGFWLTRADYDAQYVKEIYKWDVSSSSLTLFAPFKKIEGRGDTLNIGMMTITCSSPAENVLRIRLTGHAGAVKKGPFLLTDLQPYADTRIASSEDSVSITSGALSLNIRRNSPVLANNCSKLSPFSTGI